MKVAIITDTHYGARKGSKYLHDYFEHQLEEELEALPLIEGIFKL